LADSGIEIEDFNEHDINQNKPFSRAADTIPTPATTPAKTSVKALVEVPVKTSSKPLARNPYPNLDVVCSRASAVVKLPI
jgi:hypothetical protein